LRIAFLTSIYTKHADIIYALNPSLHKKNSDEQMEFIRWHALSSLVRWIPLLEAKGCKVIEFHHNLENVETAWAKENHFQTDLKSSVIEIGLEKIKRFKPDIIFCISPVAYTNNQFIKSLLSEVKKCVKLVAWYGADCGNESIFSQFDLTLSNSAHLVHNLRNQGMSAEVLRHSFDPIILEKIGSISNKINRVAFFGNLDNRSKDFCERTEFICDLSKNIPLFDIFGNFYRPNIHERFKFYFLEKRYEISSTLLKVLKSPKLKYWSNYNNLPPSPWTLPKEFISSIKKPLFGHEMLTKLNSYQIAFNYHNKHTGDCSCNMRIFEATGLGCCLLTDYKSNIHTMFEEDREVVTYKTIEEAITKANYLIENPQISREIGLAAQKKTLLKYNSIHQVDDLFNIFKNLL
jgi:spore maturation protein CgeB